MSTSTGKTISLPTINEVEGYKTMEGLINFLRDQNIGLEDKHFNILHEQEVDDKTFLRLNMDKLMKANVKLGLAEKISGLIEKIKGEGQIIYYLVISSIDILSSREQTLYNERHFSDLDNYEEEQQKNVKKIQNYPVPSTFALFNNFIDYQTKNQQLFIHCPSECVGPPVQVYHNIFNQFLHDYHNEELEIEKKHYNWTLEFIHEMAEIYWSELKCQQVFNEKIHKLFDEELKVIYLDDNYSNDGMKNEIGTGGCDPTVQAEASYTKYYTQKKNGKMLQWCNWPFFLLCLAGPWVCILGAVYVEKPIIDPLTDFIPLISTNDRAHTERVAWLFKALHLGVNKLTEYYGSLDAPTDPQNSHRFFPYLNQYEQQNTIMEFIYERKLVDQPNKLLWKAITKEAENYLVDRFYIVVIDYVEAEQLYECNSLSHDEYKAVFKDIKEAIDKLHKKNIVFADLRDSNILVNKSQGQYRGMELNAKLLAEICELRKKVVEDEVEKTKLRQELKARTDELKETISHYSVEIGKLNAIIVELEKNKTVTAKLESENAKFRDRITKVEQRQMLSNNVSKLPMEMDTSLPEESIPEGLPEPAVNISVMDQYDQTFLENKKTDSFLNEVHKKKDISSVKSHDDRSSLENLVKNGTSITNRDDRQKNISVITTSQKNNNDNIEFTKSQATEQIPLVSHPSSSLDTLQNLVYLFQNAIQAGHEMILFWLYYLNSFENKVDEIRHNTGASDKTTRSQIYKEMLEHLLSITLGNLCMRTLYAKKIHMLFGEGGVGIDKVKQVTFSIYNISSLTINQIQSVIKNVTLAGRILEVPNCNYVTSVTNRDDQINAPLILAEVTTFHVFNSKDK
ncbi:12133_t:CDS:10, partial [Cetraspora pellucida]